MINATSRPARPGSSGSLRRALCGLLAALAFAVVAVSGLSPSTAVAAGPPTLTANPNPVVMPPGQTSATYTLKWSTGNGQPGSLYVSVDNGPVAGPLAVASDGTFTPTINDGDTHQWKLMTADGRSLRTNLTVTTKHPDQSCKEGCIKLVTFDPHGTFAPVHIVTTHPVNVKVEVHENGKPNADEKSKSGQTDWNTSMDNLKPGTEYQYVVTATDESNNVQFSKGTFKTLHRHVQVNFESITAIDDSDDLSAGDLTFWFRGNGTWDMVNTYGEVSIDTGDTAHPNHIENYVDTADTLTIAVYGYDDDCDLGEFCTSGIGPTGSGGGSNDEQDWATAWGSMNVAASGPNEAFSGATDFSTVGWALEFSVHASFSVSYS